MGPPQRFTAVVPVKPLALAKSRLDLPADQRRSLALAFAVDTIIALRGSPLVAGVVVVTSDPDVVRRVRPLGVRLVTDAGCGLRAAITDGAQVAALGRDHAGVAVVPADLPCLRADDVTRVLVDAAGHTGAFVPDLAGTGTTLLVSPPGRAVVTRYGPGSAAAHAALGLHRLADAPVGARRDVDTLADLKAAGRCEPGPETTVALAETLDPVERSGP